MPGSVRMWHLGRGSVVALTVLDSVLLEGLSKLNDSVINNKTSLIFTKPFIFDLKAYKNCYSKPQCLKLYIYTI